MADSAHPRSALVGQDIEMVACRHPSANEMEAYERVLGDAMVGDATHFARQDYVEEAWRIVDPVLRPTPRCTSTKKAPGDPTKSTKECCLKGVGTTRLLRTVKTSVSLPRPTETIMVNSRSRV